MKDVSVGLERLEDAKPFTTSFYAPDIRKVVEIPVR